MSAYFRQYLILCFIVWKKSFNDSTVVSEAR